MALRYSVSLDRQKVNLSTVFVGQKVSTQQVVDKIRLVSYLEYDLGYLDKERGGNTPLI